MGAFPRRRHRLAEGSEHWIILLHCLVLGCVLHYHNWLPDALPEDASLEVYSAGRTLKHLKAILDTGVRTVGSRANEAVTPHYIVSEVERLNVSSNPNSMELDLQWPSGGFATSFLGGFVNTYHRVTNIIVRVTPKGVDKNTAALLVSAHYDSSLGTVGASDDCLNIAAMLEIMRLVVRSDFTHPIIFNFNGAEETNWQAAHGFISQHPWAKNLKAQVNLEASGTGGREIVLQNGPKNAWIGRTYVNSVPYPHVHGVAQLIFESGVLPAQTDFQTYRDFHQTMKKMPGMDFAVIQGGHVYHTPQDDLDHVDPNHVQRLGENIVPLVIGLASSPYLSDPKELEEEADTTFDVLGLAVVCYSKGFGRLLNIAVLASVAYVAWRTSFGKTHFLSGNAFRLLKSCVLTAFGASIAAPATVAVVLTTTGANISWYSHNWLAFVLYAVPAVTAQCFFYGKHHEKIDEDKLHTCFDALVAAVTLFYCVLVVPLVLLDHTLTSFMILVWFLPFYGRLAMSHFTDSWVFEYSQVIFTATCLPGLLLWWQLFITILGFFLPLTGRIGDAVPPNLIVGLISGAVMAFAFAFPSIAILHFRRKKDDMMLKAATVIFIFGVICAMFVLPVYTTERPKRLFVQHVHRKWHDVNGNIEKEDSGLWVNPMDYRGLAALMDDWPVLRTAPVKSNVCSKSGGDLYCDLPWLFPVSDMLGGGRWISTKDPDVQKISLTSNREVLTRGSNGRQKIMVEVTGPTHMTAVIHEGDGAKVVAWSFAHNMIPPRADCKCYWVFHGDGAPEAINSKQSFAEHLTTEGPKMKRYNYAAFGEPRVWNFWIEVEGDAQVKLAVYGHYLDTPMTQSQEELFKTLPNWALEVSWISTWASYIV